MLRLFPLLLAFAVPAAPVHDLRIGAVKALPGGTLLTQSHRTTIIASTNLRFSVRVKNNGEARESRVRLTLTVLQHTPIVVKRTIATIEPGTERTVVLPIRSAPLFAVPLKLMVSVAPVPGEARLRDNLAQYPIVFEV
jgi:hypothetical protein